MAKDQVSCGGRRGCEASEMGRIVDVLSVFHTFSQVLVGHDESEGSTKYYILCDDRAMMIIIYYPSKLQTEGDIASAQQSRPFQSQSSSSSPLDITLAECGGSPTQSSQTLTTSA